MSAVCYFVSRSERRTDKVPTSKTALALGRAVKSALCSTVIQIASMRLMWCTRCCRHAIIRAQPQNHGHLNLLASLPDHQQFATELSITLYALHLYICLIHGRSNGGYIDVGLYIPRKSSRLNSFLVFFLQIFKLFLATQQQKAIYMLKAVCLLGRVSNWLGHLRDRRAWPHEGIGQQGASHRRALGS